MTESKKCKECGVLEAVSGEKYCKKCRKVILAELKWNGYLQDTNPRNVATFSDERGRRRKVDLASLGGQAEMNSDGDD